MAHDPENPGEAMLLGRLRELETRLQESEDTLDAIRRGEVDALVVGGPAEEKRVYTLEGADRPYRVLIEQMQEGAVTLGEDGTVLYCNRRLAGMLGLLQERVIGHSLRRLVLPEEAGAFDRLFDGARHSVARAELTLCAADGARLPVYMSLSPLRSEEGAMLLCGVLTDLTEQKLHLRELAEANARLTGEIAERERVEDALRQSQKMEAVGQLTGGLAHDFNNLLTGITGSLELLQTRMAQGRTRDVDRYVMAAQGAARRAAALTHRLLAFSRRQTLDPKPTDVNRLVAGMAELVRRTVGPGIAVEPIAGGGLWTTLVDPGQLENALLNLCINARDAMPDGGQLTIETGNKWLDERAARERELPPGQYITLCVSDNGTGMPSEVIARAFDPFFTTKPIGMGTGLGLSMVYGFVRQSGGQVRIYSELGQGTMMCLYLPRHHGEADDSGILAELADAPRAGRDETVLVIDDEPTVRMLVTDVLEDLGYTAIEAADGAAGLKVLQSDTRIDLLVTDVGLPGGMNGRQVADAARAIRPRLNVLFITGYAENAVLSHGHLDAGMHVLTKPFAMETLASRIKDLITGR
jgi:PAS domain S-box-containing protein